MKLLADEALERSAVVANCRMNRERNLVGSNGYTKELGFNPLDFLEGRVGRHDHVAWLDLCCGTGKALVEAARSLQAADLHIEIVGIDLVDMFRRPDPDLSDLRLVAASLSTWRPRRRFDLITCVHGLHYVGDKLGLITRAASWLVEDGLLIANLDLQNLRIAEGKDSSRRVASELRRVGFQYDARKRLLVCRRRQHVELPYRYLGADDNAGPNYTGQPAVNSHYEYVR